MNLLFKATTGVLTTLIMWLTLNKHAKDMSVLLTLAVCAMVAMVSVSFLQPVVRFLKRIQELGNLDSDLLSVVLKVVGVGFITEIATLVCKDAGNESMGKILQFLSTVAVLWMSIPVFEKLLSLLDKILGTV